MDPARSDSIAAAVGEAESDARDGVTTLVAAIRSGITYVVIGLYLLLAAPPGLVLALVFRWKGLLYELGRLGIWLALHLAGIRYTVEGRERLPKGRAVVFCANHQSNVDPPVLFMVLHRRLHILFKASLAKLPLLGQVILVGGFVPVDRENRDQAMASIDRGSESIRQGNSFLIFPEGTRSRTRNLLPFKKGGFIMAIQAQAPIVPVAIDGGRAAMRRGSVLMWPARVRVRIGEPVETAGAGLDDRDRLIAVTRERIERLLASGDETPTPRPA